MVHYIIFMSEINNSSSYVPCRGWWVKPPQVINLQPGQTVTFARFAPEDGVYMDSFDPGTCTGTPAAPPGVTQPPPQPPADTGLCPAKMNGEWNARLTLRSTNDPDLQDEIGDVEEEFSRFRSTAGKRWFNSSTQAGNGAILPAVHAVCRMDAT